ncbi:MAG: hydrogenase maturation protease, partial [Coriobacteriia bacterium]|nr:hydrogenase maturation protease [Coriobacteriia bacterium]
MLGVGNILKLDEGVGPHVITELIRGYEFPENVLVFDRATMGMQLLSDLNSCGVLLVVDAVDNTGNPPGTVVTFAPEDLARYDTFHGAHDTRLVDVLDAAELLGYRPEAHCLGVQVENMSPADLTIGLTPAVAAAVPLLLYSVLSFLRERGVAFIDKKTHELWDGINIRSEKTEIVMMPTSDMLDTPEILDTTDSSET